MAVEQVTVIDAGQATARIHARTRHQCNQCALQSGCGHQLLAGAFAHSRDVTAIPLPLTGQLQGQVAAGDILELVINENSLVSLSLLQYLLPLVCMLAGTAIAANLAAATGAGEGWVVLAALGTLGLGLAWVRKIADHLAIPAELSRPGAATDNPGFDRATHHKQSGV